MDMDSRPIPEECLEEIQRAERAKLTNYLGFAAGAGKTRCSPMPLS